MNQKKKNKAQRQQREGNLIKSRAEINEIETKTTIQKVNGLRPGPLKIKLVYTVRLIKQTREDSIKGEKL